MGRPARRIWITLGLVGMLGACAQPGGDTGLQSAAKRGDGDALRYFEPEFSALLDLVVDGLGRACAGSATDDDRLNACLRDQFASAFDDSRLGRRHCDFHTEVVKFIGCIAIGNTLIDVRHRLSDDTPVPAAFWREEEAMVDAFTKTIVERGIDACGGTEDTKRVRECVIDWFEKQVALPGSLADRCQDQTVEEERYTCLVEGMLLRYLQDHVPRLGAVST
jgi:hypothetical protein